MVCRQGKGEAGFVADVRLVFENVPLYAGPETGVYKMVCDCDKGVDVVMPGLMRT